MKPLIYLDHAATTPLRSEVLDAMQPFLQSVYGNPSSLYRLGREANKAIVAAKESIAACLSVASPDDLIFTAGGTESNNLALKGVAFGLAHRGKHIITSQIEHPAILEPCAWLATQGFEITYLPVDAEGFVNPADLAAALRPDTILVSIMHGNNEIGTLQPIGVLGDLARQNGTLFHTDAVQTVGKLAMDLTALPVDLVSVSGHKLYGPKGVGLLYANEAVRTVLMPLLHGGGQQQGFRSGTENVAAIVGLAKALALATAERAQTVSHLRALQQQLIAGIREIAPQAKLNGPQYPEHRVPGIVNVSFSPVEGEALVLRMDLEGIAVSSGSACHSGQLNASYVVMATGVDETAAKSTLRFSLGKDTTATEIDAVLTALPRVLVRTGYLGQPHASASVSP